MASRPRTCFIVNPSAKGDRARSFLQSRHHWRPVGECLETAGPGDGERLALKAVQDGFTTIIAAGGDGTVLEVLNGIMHAPQHVESIRFGVLPLGTVNVFSKELGMPQTLEACRTVFLRSNTKRIDIPRARFLDSNQRPCQRYFAQLGGTGLDAFAIQAVNWKLKKWFGPFAYVWAGFKAMSENLPSIQCRGKDGTQVDGSMILFGNGSYYGGRFRIFPEADLSDGLLHALVFHDLTWKKLPSLGWDLWRDRLHLRSDVTYLKSTRFELNGNGPVPLELEGDLAGSLPGLLEMSATKLQVILP